MASSAESLKIWEISHSQLEDTKVPKPICVDTPFFEHLGHLNKITDFSWNIESPWTFISASDDFEPSYAGCSL